MPTFRWREQDVELIKDIDDLEVDDAELIEEQLGLDLRDITSAPLVRQLKAFVLISIRRVDQAATLADAGRVKLGPLLAAFTPAKGTAQPAPDPAPARAPVEFTGTLTVPLTVTDGTDGGEVLSPTSAGSEPSLPA
jgi:hypothetical protein